MQNAVPATIGLACFSLVVTAAETLSTAVFQPKGVLNKANHLLTTLFYCAVVGLFFATSLVRVFTVILRR